MPEIYELNDAQNYSNAAANDVWRTFAGSAMDMYKTKKAEQREDAKVARDSESDKQKAFAALAQASIASKTSRFARDGETADYYVPMGGDRVGMKNINESSLNPLETLKYKRELYGLPEPKEMLKALTDSQTNLMTNGIGPDGKPYSADAAWKTAMGQLRGQYGHVPDEDWNSMVGLVFKKASVSDIGDEQLKKMLGKLGKDYIAKEVDGGEDWLKANSNPTQTTQARTTGTQSAPNPMFGSIVPAVANTAGSVAKAMPAVVSGVGNMSKNVGIIPAATLAVLPQMAKAAASGMANNPFAGTALRNAMLSKAPGALRAFAQFGGSKLGAGLANPFTAIPAAAMTGYQIGSAIERPVNDGLHDAFVNMYNPQAYQMMMQERQQQQGF